jgi:RNA polymerase sigma factor (sigma-70 family)
VRMATSLRSDSTRSEALASPGSFEEFFRAQYPVVVRIAYGVVRDVHLAEDVAQEVLMAAQRRFPEPYPSDHAAAWARIAASHLALNAVRSRERRGERHKQQPLDGPSIGPEDVAIDRDEGSEVRMALSRLPRHSATVLVLRHSGLSYAEVADAMGVKVGQVGTMLRRAEAALRKELDRATRS